MTGYTTRRDTIGLKQRTFSPERYRCYCDEHERIVAAIRERDPEAAHDAMREHLQTVRRTLLGNQP